MYFGACVYYETGCSIFSSDFDNIYYMDDGLYHLVHIV